ncbi:hypothetical protein TorRG33x02_074820 [Trema orientale]|uniref:RNase H type-1 domain-containing protein n=1 Tax=Trema orientale TaxID=63057 RepID=A0A2P5FG49_TREOI|nr:hypothetical protein TorRG33x02_074820 [Trema orientale]
MQMRILLMHYFSVFIRWLFLLSELDKSSFETLAVVLWQLWNERNHAKHGLQCLSPSEVREFAGRYIFEFQEAFRRIEIFEVLRVDKQAHWKLHAPGKLKLNVGSCCFVGRDNNKVAHSLAKAFFS